jgi:hypothetical protein
MIQCGKWETAEEIQIMYPKEQRNFYEKKDSRCIYGQFPRQVGINKGNFVEMVAKKYFEERGYAVQTYDYLVRNRNKRERMPGFKKICYIFGEAQARLLIAEADRAFRSIGKKIASVEADLFVCNESTGDRFFGEVKGDDQITDNQRILFPLIQKILCPVFVARVIGKRPNAPADGAKMPLP